MSDKQKYKKDSFTEKNEESMEQKETNSNASSVIEGLAVPDKG